MLMRWSLTHLKLRFSLLSLLFSLNFFLFCVFLDNFYGTPKPPAEPSTLLLLNVTDQLLPGARPSSEGKRKRNKSVSNMEKASIEPPEEAEEEERPIVNGNGVAVTPGQHRQQPSKDDGPEVDPGRERHGDSSVRGRARAQADLQEVMLFQLLPQVSSRAVA